MGDNIDCEVILFLVGAIFGLIGIKKLRKFLLLYNNEEKKITTGIANTNIWT